MKKFFVILALLFVFPYSVSAQDNSKLEATITSINNGKVQVQMEEGKNTGKKFPIGLFDENQIKTRKLQTGDRVLVQFVKGPGGADQVVIVDQVRKTPLLVLFAVFLFFVIAIGRLKGILSFIGMIFSFVVIGNFIIPQIMLGNDPLLISLLGSLFIIPLTFYIAHGIRTHTTIAVVGTFFALVLTGALAYFFVYFAKLTGYAAEEAVFIQALPGKNINLQSLLLAGILIGAMGVLDDITISQTSIVAKLIKANPKYTFWQVYKEAMDVGRDHIASLVNTLVLVYAGAALPLFVLFYNAQLGGYSEVVNMEIVATEIVRTLVSSIGIIAAVPITTLLAARYLKK
jgi:uncharacterized membrane protein